MRPSLHPATALILMILMPPSAALAAPPAPLLGTDLAIRDAAQAFAPGSETACAAYFLDLAAWARASTTTRRIGAKMSSAKITNTNPASYPWGHGAYSEAAFGASGATTGRVLMGRFKVLFSDRTVPGGSQRFAHAKSDLQDIGFYSDGRISITLRSWGDAVLFLQDVRCYRDGFVTGINREGNGVSLVSFALRKENIDPAWHPGAWPG